jgi:hypothetical protein
VNGKRVFVAQVNGNQIGVPVGIGGSYMEIEYAPKNLRKAFYPFFAGLIIFAGLTYYWFRNRPERLDPPGKLLESGSSEL